MLETREKTIGNHTYYVRQLGATKGRQALVRLVKTLGPVLGAALGGMSLEQMSKSKEPINVMDMDADTIAPLLESLATHINESDLEWFCDTFGECTQVKTPEGGQVPLNKEKQELHFAGRYGEMFRWLGFCLEVNFKDFLSIPVSGLGAAAGQPAPESNGQN